MPDSFPPLGWGPPQFDEQDLDALLSGELTDIPVALRQVAEALTALRAAPTSAELSGEAMIMAEFRALAEFPELGLGEATPPDGLARARELPVLPSALGGRPRRPARHRAPGRHRERRTTRLLSRPGVVLTAAAAAAVIVAAVAFAGGLSGPIHDVTRTSTVTPSRPGSSGGDFASPGLAARSAAAEPTASPSPSAGASPPQSQASRLCRAFFGYPGSGQQGQTWWLSLSLTRQQLSQLAGGPERVYGYCKPYLANLFPHGQFTPPSRPGQHWGAPANSGPGSPQGNQGNTGQGQGMPYGPGSHP